MPTERKRTPLADAILRGAQLRELHDQVDHLRIELSKLRRVLMRAEREVERHIERIQQGFDHA